MEKIICRTGRILFPKGIQEVPSDCGFAIMTAKDEDGSDFTIKGGLAGLRPDMDAEISGEWRTDSWGRHFRTSSWSAVIPTSERGIEEYLASGLISGIGAKRARKIVEAFGKDTLEVLDKTPERLREVEGLGRKTIQQIARSWDEQRGVRDVMVFLKEYGVSNCLAGKIFKKYGQQSVSLIRENPYRLADDIKGVGFTTADTLALSMGLPREGIARRMSGALYVLDQACETEGHVFLPESELCTRSAKALGVSLTAMKEALDTLVSEHRVYDEDGAVYSPACWFAEKGVASRLKALAVAKRGDDSDMVDVGGIRKRTGFDLDPKQEDAVRAAAGSSLTVLTGGPGTGKTTTTRAILEAFRDRKYRILLAAPTGRAAKRLSEATGMPARTLHRLLEYTPNGGYGRNAGNPLEGDALIVDETSMMDIHLMHALLKAVPDGMRVLLVGDVDQLPSVGAGNVLRDIIQSGTVNTVVLTKIFRQAERSRIVTNAHLINRGAAPDLGNAPGTDFFFIPKEKVADADNKEAIADAVVRSMDRFHERFGVAYGDMQVLAPMRKTAFIGTDALNATLQEHLNASGRFRSLKYGETEFRIGDRVMQIRNNYDKGVFNGDIGSVVSLDPGSRTMSVSFDDCLADYKGDEFSEVVLSYATTVHKAQGSECPVIIIPVSRSFSIMNQRNLLYTAVTRAKKYCVLVGERAAVMDMVRNDRIQKRYSMLAERLQAANGIK